MQASTKGSKKTPDQLIGVLMECQKAKKKRYLTKEDLKAVAKEMQLPESRVYSVATFYSLISTEPRGKHIVQVCKDVSCYVNGSFNVLDELENALEIKVGETTKDGMFTLEHTSCLGYCEIAPVMRIDEKIYGNLDSEKLVKIIAGYRRDARNG